MWPYLFARQVIVVCCFLFLLLAACGPEEDMVTPATRPPATATATSTPTFTPTAAATDTVLTSESFGSPRTDTTNQPASPTLTATSVPTPAIPAEPSIISPENAEQLTQLNRFGNGRIREVSWSPDGTLFMVNSSRGLELYDARTLQLVYTIEDGAGSASFSPLGDLLLGVNCDDYFCYTSLWDTASGENLDVLGIGSSLEFTPDGEAVILEETGTGLVWRALRTRETLRTIALSCHPFGYRFAGAAFVHFCEDNTVYLYDAASGQLRHTLEELVNVDQVELSPQGELLAVGLEQDRTTTLRLYDVANGQLRYTIELPVAVNGFYFSPQGELLVASRYDNVVQVWDVQSGELLWEGRNVVFSTDGRIIATVGDDYVVRVWNAQSGEVLHQLEGDPSGTHIGFSPDGRILVAGSYNNVVRVWDVPSGQLLVTGRRVVFSPNGPIMVTLGDDNMVRLWDTTSGEVRHEMEGQPSRMDFVFSPDGRILAHRGKDKTLYLWDTVTGQLLHALALPHGGDWRYFSPNGRELAVQSAGSVLFYEVASGALRGALEGYSVLGYASDLTFSPDSNMLITASGYDVRTLDVYSGQLLQTRQSDEPVGSIAISPDGSLMAWGGGEQKHWLQLWDRTTEQLLYTIEEEGEPVNEVAFSPDGQLLATRSGSWGTHLVQVRQASTGQVLFSHEASLFAFSQDGRLFATDDPERTVIEVWDSATFQLVRQFDHLTLLAFDPDGNILARPQEAGAMRGLWDVASGELLRTFAEGDFFLYRVFAYSPDNRLLLGHGAGVMGHGYATLWDTHSGEAMSWSADYGPASTGAFSPDGRLLAVVNGDGSVQLWGLPDGTLETGD